MPLNRKAQSLPHRKQCLCVQRQPDSAPKTPRHFSVVVLVVALVGCGGSGGAGGSAGNPVAPSNTGPPATAASVPTGLAMPVRVDDINLRGVINPFGVVRSSLDLASLGHSGVDVPLNTGAPIFAVAGGQIVSVRPSIDSRPGNLVKILLGADSPPGSGWVFLYEHVTLLGGLGVDSVVTRGQQIATNTMEPAFGNHLELAHTFNNFEFHENQTCWVDQLDWSARNDLMTRFDTELRADPRFISAWLSVGDRKPFRALLNTEKYPEGARLCYAPGTDERVDP